MKWEIEMSECFPLLFSISTVADWFLEFFFIHLFTYFYLSFFFSLSNKKSNVSNFFCETFVIFKTRLNCFLSDAKNTILCQIFSFSLISFSDKINK